MLDFWFSHKLLIQPIRLHRKPARVPVSKPRSGRA
jgi:hypothetical protein